MEQKTEALYLINGDRFLHLRENGAGVGFATYDCATGEPLESGQISKQNLPPDGRNAISAARNWYLFELSSDDRKAIRRSACSTSIPFRSLVSAGGASGMTPQFPEMMFALSTATTMTSIVCRIMA